MNEKAYTAATIGTIIDKEKSMTKEEWTKENPIAERALIYHNPFEEDDRPPFQFGFAADERAWLRAERTEEELAEFAKNTDVSLELFTMFFNTDGFQYGPEEFVVEKRDGGFVLFIDEDGEKTEFATITKDTVGEDWDAFVKHMPASGGVIDADVVMYDDHCVLLFPEPEDEDLDTDEMDNRTISILLQYIKCLQIRSYFDLCRKANKAVANMREYNNKVEEKGYAIPDLMTAHFIDDFDL